MCRRAASSQSPEFWPQAVEDECPADHAKVRSDDFLLEFVPILPRSGLTVSAWRVRSRPWVAPHGVIANTMARPLAYSTPGVLFEHRIVFVLQRVRFRKGCKELLRWFECLGVIVPEWALPCGRW